MIPTSDSCETSDPAASPRPGEACDPRIVRSRAKLLAAATELLVDHGPRGFTVDAVAERSGVAKSTLYRHWDSRQELLVDVIRSNVPVLSSPDLGRGFETALRSLLGEVASTLAAPEWARIMPAIVSLRQHLPDMARLFEADREAKARVLSEVLELGVAEGRLPPGLDPHRVAHLLIGPLVFASISGSESDIRGLADHAVDRFIASYAATVSP